MYDEVTSIEEHGLSRMEAMETVNLSSSLVSVDYAAFVQNSNLRHIEFGNAITSIAKYAIANCPLLEKVSISDFGNLCFLISEVQIPRILKALPLTPKIFTVISGYFTSVITHLLSRYFRSKKHFETYQGLTNACMTSFAIA